MPRPPERRRCSLAHIQRGNSRALRFHAEEDYRRHLDDLAEQAQNSSDAWEPGPYSELKSQLAALDR